VEPRRIVFGGWSDSSALLLYTHYAKNVQKLRKGGFFMANLKWSEADKELVRANYKRLTDREFVEYFNKCGHIVTLAAFRKFRQRLRLSKKG